MHVVCDEPGFCDVTSRTVLAKVARVNIIDPMAGSAVEQTLFARQIGFRTSCGSCTHPVCQPRPEPLLIRAALAKFRQADSRERRVIHVDRSLDARRVLVVTCCAAADRRMESARLALKQCRLIRMAGDAIGTGDPRHGAVASCAIVLQEGVRSGERSRTVEALPRRGPSERRPLRANYG